MTHNADASRAEAHRSTIAAHIRACGESVRDPHDPTAWPSRGPADVVARELVQQLVCGYCALAYAATYAARLVAADVAYRGGIGWDLEIAIDDAKTAIRNSVRVHNLARLHPFFNDGLPYVPHDPQHVPRDQRALPRDVSAYLVGAFTAIQHAAATAESLVQLDHTYIGTVGWDLETAVDDALIAVRDAARVGDLARLHPFWDGKL